MADRRSNLEFSFDETPEIGAIYNSKKYRDLRRKLAELKDMPRGTPLRIDVQLPDSMLEADSTESTEADSAAAIQEEVKSVQNAVYSWARATRLHKAGLTVTAAKKILDSQTAVVRVEIVSAEEADQMEEEIQA